MASEHDRPRAAAYFFVGQSIDKCDHLVVESLYCLLGLARMALLNLAGAILFFNSPSEHEVAFLVLLASKTRKATSCSDGELKKRIAPARLRRAILARPRRQYRLSTTR